MARGGFVRQSPPSLPTFVWAALSLGHEVKPGVPVTSVSHIAPPGTPPN